MLGMSIFKRKPRQYNYMPRYFDPEKEQREERKRILLGDDFMRESDAKYVPGKYIHKARLSRMKGEVSTKDKNKTALVRFIIFIVLLLLAAYFIITYDGFAKMLGV